MWRQRHPPIRFAIIYLGLDRFKLVNESLGYVHGDDMVVAASRRFEQSLKFGDNVARLGDDELVILLEEIATTGDAKNILESL